MNKEILDKLLEYIDARIAEESAKDSSDGGLNEIIIKGQIKDELFDLVK